MSGTVRVADFSLTGCFVEGLASPAPGEAVLVTLRLPGAAPVPATGRVAYVVPLQGFAVMFDEDERLQAALAAAIRRLQPVTYSTNR